MPRLTSSVAGPADILPNRLRHRRFVARRHALDRQNQQRLGLNGFADEWTRLMAGPAPEGSRIPRRLWLLWLQGEAEAPRLVRQCFASWRRLNPEWQIAVLDARSLCAEVPMPAFPAHVRPNHVANVVRLRLLAVHGGLWTDATTLCLKPLDDWIDRAAREGFFAFRRPQPVRALANWFIASEPGAPLVEAWQRWSEIYILSRRPPHSYFWSHHTFDWLLARSSALRAAWHKTPPLSARGPHVLQRILDGHLTPEAKPTSAEVAMLPLVKLSWKKKYEVEQVLGVLRDYGIDVAEMPRRRSE